MTTLSFTKMHGAGNDYVYLDCFAQRLEVDFSHLARQISDRHFGVGGDGLICILPSEIVDAQMRMFNADGSESEMCGNGIRCVAKYIYDHNICRKETLAIETRAGVLKLSLSVREGLVDSVTVNMGRPIFEPAKVPTTLLAKETAWGNVVLEHKENFGGREFWLNVLSMGNPHCVIFVEELSKELVHTYGPLIETSPLFPAKTNVEFVQVISPDEVRQRTWERGSGETLACGTGASAVCVAGVLTGKTDRAITNHLLGGDLQLIWEEETGEVFMTGPAVEVFSGQWDYKE
ncbi:MAG: diaminopimelate epimerase [Pirellulaceae bacterium]|nr:diaminopimelate epimerase [Pirellulaceae bacterium]